MNSIKEKWQISKLPNHQIPILLKSKKVVSGQLCYIKYQINGQGEFGWQILLPVSHIKKAVDRNKIKRWAREIVRLFGQNKELERISFLIIIKKDILSNTYQSFKAELVNMINKIYA